MVITVERSMEVIVFISNNCKVILGVAFLVPSGRGGIGDVATQLEEIAVGMSGVRSIGISTLHQFSQQGKALGGSDDIGLVGSGTVVVGVLVPEGIIGRPLGVEGYALARICEFADFCFVVVGGSCAVGPGVPMRKVEPVAVEGVGGERLCLVDLEVLSFRTSNAAVGIEDNSISRCPLRGEAEGAV